MNEVTLPSSPNWYLSTMLVCTEDGTVAWGSKNNLVVGKRISNEHKAMDYAIISNAHADKVNSLSFCPDYGKPNRNLLVSGGNEHIVRVWNLETMEAALSKSYVDPEDKVIGVDWSKCDTNLICAVSTQGHLLSWNVHFNTHQRIPLGKLTATVISCSPHKSNVVAIGTKSGLIFIVNTQSSGTITYKLRGHDYEIASLSWCPTAVNVLNERYERDYLLASGAKDRSIFIWRAGGDGRYEAQVNLPNGPQDNSQHRTKLNPAAGAFTVVLWVEPTILVAGSTFGELLALKLSSIRKKQKPLWKLIHACHSRGIFSIASFVKPTVSEELLQQPDDENWRTEKEEMITDGREIWTTGQERQLVCAMPADEEGGWKIEYSIPTLAGYVYCMSPCPLDTSRIAVGAGDGMLRVWNLSEPHETTFDITTVWQKIMGRLTSISWHPEKENLLAYGTSEGRIGIYDTCNFAKSPILLRQHHRKTIYRLNWGPSPPEEKGQSNYSLYACGDGELTCFNYHSPHQQPKVIIKKSCTEFSWKPDYSCMAVGYDDGSISFLNRKLEACGKTIFLLKKPVECLAWHPDSTATDWNFSHYRDYLAASSTLQTITILDMSNMTQKLNGGDAKPGDESFYKVVANLCGHADRVFSLAWSPHISGYLVSGSADKVVQVWKIDGQQLIATYTQHRNGVQSVMWSPLDPDLVMSGSADCTLRIWRISDQKVVIPTEVFANKSKSKKSKSKSTPAVEMPEKTGTENPQAAKTDEKSVEIPKPTEKEKKPKGKKGVSFFPNYRKLVNDKETFLKSCFDLAKEVKGGKSSQTIFGSKDEISKILTTEIDTHWSQGQTITAAEMSVWNNSLKETLSKAVESKSLNDFMVSLAPSLSVRLWQELCEAYANQLILEGNPTKAVSYLLIIHKVHQAIHVLMQAKMYREAYVIARSKLEPDDSILKEIREEWSASALRCGLFEDGAQCAIADGDISKAAKLLSRRTDVPTLEAAAELALLDENKELSESIAEQALDKALSQFDYEKSRELLKKFPNIQYRLMQVEAHQEINKKINEDLFTVSFIESWLRGESTYGLIEELEKKYQELERSVENLSSFYKKLSEITYPPLLAVDQTESMLWLVVSRDIALSAVVADEEKRARHVVSALGGISQYELMHPTRSGEAPSEILIKILSMLEKTSPSSEKSIFHVDDLENVKGVHKSLKVYRCLGLLNWLVDKISKSEDSEEIPVNFFVKFISESVDFIFNQETVKYWITMSEITKLEKSLASSSKTEEDEEAKGEDNKKNTEELLQRLAEAREAQKKFLDDRVCAPSPMLAYSKATELGSLLEDGEVKDSFTKAVADAWKKATSFSSEE